MLTIGLTGGIASGKSTVSQMFEHAGIPVICLDELARYVVKPGSPALDEIRRAFGEEFVDEAGELDRAGMARIVFQDDGKRKLLESVIHPKVKEEMTRRALELEHLGHRMVVFDVPLLYEVGWEKFLDLVVVVYVPRQTQEERLMTRDAMSREEAEARLNAQLSIGEKRERADYVVDNTGSLERTREQVTSIIRDLKTREALKRTEGAPMPQFLGHNES